jgi:anti-sigma factor RsiW
MTKLDRTWAMTQIEAMADGSLSAEAERRMQALLNCDPALRAQVEQARAIRRDLRALAARPVPRGLLRRLWRIPVANRPEHSYWMPATALASVAVIALSVGLFFNLQRPTPEDLAREAAVKEFVVAVAYLQKSVVMAQNEVNEAVGSGVLSALEVSRGMMATSQTESDQGE